MRHRQQVSKKRVGYLASEKATKKALAKANRLTRPNPQKVAKPKPQKYVPPTLNMVDQEY